MTSVDVIIVGGGAAGLMCAAEAGRRGRRVLVVEHADRVGKKIAISGGGRCNFTNLGASPDNYLSANPDFCRSALARYTPDDFVAQVEKHGIAYHEKKLGQLFCDHSSREIIEMLLAECAAARAEVRTNCAVRGVERGGSNGGDARFVVATNQGTFACASLVVASGGLSIPHLGASDFGYQLAAQFNLKIIETRPALVPFTLAAEELKKLGALSGLSIDAAVECARGAGFRENILLTHRGLSGPAILQVSSYWQHGEAISIDLLPERNARAILAEKRCGEIELANLLGQFLPRRFAHAWCELYASSRPINRFAPRELAAIAARLHAWRITPNGTEGYKKAEVTAGGVAPDELSSKTMESVRVPGLYFIGEVVDVTGHLGGYNFQWAWASGYAAGQYA
ncbi:MAG: NAD(P)/FAD-dependent oxidoreductase [Pyrinomonadaceae bacterium]